MWGRAGSTLERAAQRTLDSGPWFFVLALVVLGVGLGLRDPWPADEPRFALAARDMVHSGDWFFPRVADQLYPDKPPTFMWAIAIVYAVTGSLRFAFLMPSLLAALGVLVLVRDLGARLWDARTGSIAGLALLLTLQFTVEARSAQIDMLLAFWTTLGFYGIARHMLGGPSWGWYLIGFAACGLGVITKGVGILPLLVFLPFAWGAWRGWQGLFRARDWRWFAGVPVMLLAIGLWLLPMLLLVAGSDDPGLGAYRDNILFKQTVDRYTDSWHHIKPAWYYLVEVAPWFWLPVTAALPWLVPAWRRALVDGDPRVLLTLGWLVSILLFFSISPGKRGVYILPATPALALAAAPYLSAILARSGARRTAFGLASVFVGAPALGWFYLTVLRPDRLASLVDRHGADPTAFLAILATAGALWLLISLPRRPVIALGGTLAVSWAIMGLVGYPAFDNARSGERLMRAASEAVGSDISIGVAHWKEQQMLQADRPIAHWGFRRPDFNQEVAEAAAWLLAQPERRRLLLAESVGEACFDPPAREPLVFAHRSRWYLYRADEVAADCAGRDPAVAAASAERVQVYRRSADASGPR